MEVTIPVYISEPISNLAELIAVLDRFKIVGASHAVFNPRIVGPRIVGDYYSIDDLREWANAEEA